MTPITAAGTHQGRATTAANVPPPLIVIVVHHFTRRCTTPPWRHWRIAGPMAGWLSSQRARRGELFAAAHAATSTNGTVGITGSKAPTMASTRLTPAIASNSHRNGLGKAGASTRLGVTCGALMHILGGAILTV